MDYKRKEYNLILNGHGLQARKEYSKPYCKAMDYKRKEYNLILKPWIMKEKSITLF